jgi:hypothetical protein
MSGLALKFALRANALFCGGCGIYLAAFGRLVSRLTLASPGAGGEWGFRALGVGLVAYAVLLAGLSGRAAERPREVSAVIAGDLIWVVGSAVWILFASRSLSAMGADIVAGVAAMVGLFAVLQWLAFTRRPTATSAA